MSGIVNDDSLENVSGGSIGRDDMRLNILSLAGKDKGEQIWAVFTTQGLDAAKRCAVTLLGGTHRVVAFLSQF